MRIKNFFKFTVRKLLQIFKTKIKVFKHKSVLSRRKEDIEEWKLYTLNLFQLQNLIDKNIFFDFFQLERFSLACDKKTKLLLKKARQIKEEKLF